MQTEQELRSLLDQALHKIKKLERELADVRKNYGRMSAQRQAILSLLEGRELTAKEIRNELQVGTMSSVDNALRWLSNDGKIVLAGHGSLTGEGYPNARRWKLKNDL